jgi:hypothetical protein
MTRFNFGQTEQFGATQTPLSSAPNFLTKSLPGAPWFAYTS